MIRPTLLLNEQICRRNIERMAQKASASGVRFRPHFKTHQSAAIGEWYRAQGVTAITTSSVQMATYFAQNGWPDITIAVPVNWLEIDQMNELAQQIHLGLVIESIESARFLAENIQHDVDVWLEVDAGYPRTGVAWDDPEKAGAICEIIRAAPHLNLVGLLAHAGNTYAARNQDDIIRLYNESVERMNALRAALKTALKDAPGLNLRISVGDTPGCSTVSEFVDVDEIRPGNFVFYDVTQSIITSCTVQDIAVAVACPVISIHPERSQIVVYGGGVHLGKDSVVDAQGQTIYGLVAPLTATGWSDPFPDTFVSSLSQEHGVIQAHPSLCESIHIGDSLAILPVHSCMTADLLKRYHTINGRVIEMARYE